MRKKTLVQKCLAIGLCLFVGLVLLQTFDLGPWKDARNHISKIPLNSIEHLGFLTLEAQINGTPIRMLIDTAANRSIFDISLIEELDLNSVQSSESVTRLANDEVPVESAHIENFMIGECLYHGEFSFVDLSQTLRKTNVAGEPPILGLIGSEFLCKWEARIDYRDMYLTIRKPRE